MYVISGKGDTVQVRSEGVFNCGLGELVRHFPNISSQHPGMIIPVADPHLLQILSGCTSEGGRLFLSLVPSLQHLQLDTLSGGRRCHKDHPGCKARLYKVNLIKEETFQ